MENAFYFILKAFFVLKIFKFLSWFFGLVEKTVYFPAPDPLLGLQPEPWPQFIFTNPDPGYGPQFVFTSSGQEFTATTTATSTITTTTATTTTTTTITTTTTTTNNNNNNKRCLRGSKIRIKWPLKGIWWKSQVLFQ